jgi:hypothetical protein
VATAAGAATLVVASGLTETALAAGGSSAIRPFSVHFADADLADLRRRLMATRWPERETVDNKTQGVRLATIQALARYWTDEYDWRKCEAYLNGLPQFVTEINMPATLPDDVSKALAVGGPAPPGLSADESHAWDQLDFFWKHGLGYAQEMSNRPQTLYALADSPLGLAAWMLDHDARSYDLIARVFDGKTEGLSKQDVVDNITLYWLTNTAVSSARLYWESKLAFFAPKGVELPTAVSAFPDEIYTAPRSWTEKAYPKLIYYNGLPEGGHFAWEQPQEFTSELRAAFRSLHTA